MKIINKIKALSKAQLSFIIAGILLFAFGLYKIVSNEAIISKGVTVNAVITDIDPEKPEKIAVRSNKFGYICISAAAAALFAAHITGYKKEAHYKNYY